MKVIYVVDSVSDLKSKINLVKSKFGNDILYVVNNKLLPIFKTYEITAHAVYGNNLLGVIQDVLLKSPVDDIVICHSSLLLTDASLTTFINAIGKKDKIVNFMPEYNAFERFGNSIYNVYVKSLFKVKDSLASPKLQFLPADFIIELMTTHFGNKMFELGDEYVKTVRSTDKSLNESAKVKVGFNPKLLYAIIAMLVITAGLILSLAFIKVNFLLVFVFVMLYLLDIFLTVIIVCKTKFDKRFFNK